MTPNADVVKTSNRGGVGSVPHALSLAHFIVL
jgi:hypothetical protein